jgi:hypothetical protein
MQHPPRFAIRANGVAMSVQPALTQERHSFTPEPFVDADTAAAFLGITRRT